MRALRRSIQIGVETMSTGERRVRQFFFAALLLLVLPIAAKAQGFTWVTNNGTITITQYTDWSTIGTVTVPSNITGLAVTSIGAGAFYPHTNVLGVVIPDSVTNIGNQAFQFCEYMRTASLGQGLIQIGDQAFSSCWSLDHVVLPDAVVSIGVEAFTGSGLTNVVIPNRVANIPSNSFNCYTLQSATVGSGVTNIESNAFAGSGALTSIFFLGNAPTADLTVFSGQPTTVYYLAGTSGWGPTFAGRPTVLWGTPPPAVTVDPATQITSTNATVTGTVNPNGLPTAFRAEWGFTTNYGSISFYVSVPVQSSPESVTNWMTSLNPNTLYHYRLTATNGVGQGASADMTLTTAAANGQPPTVTVNGSSTITSTNATITGTINPNGLFTGYYVQWGPTTAYGQFGPVLSLPAQNTSVAVTNSMIGLSPSTTYHYQLVGTNDAGRGYSADMTLTTLPAGPPGLPTVVTGTASAITTTNATIMGTVNPNGLITTYYFEWGTTSNYGNVLPSSSLPVQSTVTNVTAELTSLTPSTTYHYQLVATNSAGSAAGGDRSFTTQATNGQVPTVTIINATNITSTNATIRGTINPNGLSTGYYVQWGATTAYGQLGPILPLSAQNATILVSNQMVGLSPNTFYHCQMVATNAAGIGYSADLTLTTASGPATNPLPPTVNTGTAWPVTATNATISGTINPNELATTYSFLWGTTTAYGNTSAPGSLPAQSAASSVSANLAGLSPSTTYHYQLTATNSTGNSSGGDQTFTTPAFTSTDSNGFTYITNNGTITITGYVGPGGDVVIPSTIDGMPVTSIGDNAFYNLNNLTGVTIPDCVTNLGEAAFAECQNLTSIILGKGITSIKGGGEAGTWGTFVGCSSLTRVTIPDNVTNISDGGLSKGGPVGAFADCTSLTNVIIGKGLAYLGDGTFSWCNNLLSVFCQGNAPVFAVSWYPVLNTCFFNATNVIVYYLPGTTGWGSMAADRPAVLWNPQVNTADGNFGMRDSGFGFNITGAAGIPLVVDACVNPAEGGWVSLQTCTLTNGSFYFSDPRGTNMSRFYRIRSP